MNSLTEILQAHLAGEAGLSELSAALSTCGKELASHQEDISSMIAGIPDFLVAVERDAWLFTYSELNRKLNEVLEDVRDRGRVEEFATALPTLLNDLSMHSLSVREGAWAARGPTSHAGVNELLHLLERWVDDSNDQVHDLIQAKLDVEFARLENQAELMQNLPEFAALAMEELLPEYQGLLESIAVVGEMDEEEVEELFSRLEDWGGNFSAYDVDFVTRRYSRAPTQIPSVNLALNSQLLYLDGLIAVEMVDHNLDVALETLQAASDKFLQENPSLTEVDRAAYVEVLDELLAGLEQIPELEERDSLKERGAKLIELTSRFVDIQTSSETESGSRLDWKTE